VIDVGVARFASATTVAIAQPWIERIVHAAQVGRRGGHVGEQTNFRAREGVRSNADVAFGRLLADRFDGRFVEGVIEPHELGRQPDLFARADHRRRTARDVLDDHIIGIAVFRLERPETARRRQPRRPSARRQGLARDSWKSAADRHDVWPNGMSG